MKNIVEKIRKKNPFKSGFKLQFQSVLHKMLASFSVIILFIVGIILVSVSSSYRASQQTNLVIREYVPAMYELDDLANNFMERNKVAYEYIVTNNNERIIEFSELTEESREIETRLKKVYDNSEIDKLIDISAVWAADMETDVLEQNKAGNALVASSNLNRLTPLANSIHDIYEKNIELLGEDMAVAGDQVSSLQTLVFTATISLGVIVIGISIAIAWFTSKSIVDPVQAMKTRLEEFMHEDFSSPELEIDSKDEIGELASYLNTTQRYFIHLMDSIQMNSETITNSSQDVSRTVEEVETGTLQITATMQELASGSEAQANSANNLSSEMGEFANITAEALTYSEDISNASEGIVQKAQESNQFMSLTTDQMRIVTGIVEEAVAQMQTLDGEVQEISNLIDLVNNISNQTNLLALNASIEAARAGEQGRGFAVVAEEVRKLAEEVKGSVAEITNYVNSVQSNSQKVSDSLQGVNAEVEISGIQMEATGQNINEITQGISDLQKQNVQMTNNLNDISERSQEINTSIEEIASVTEESAAGVEETSASIEEITSSMNEVNGQAENLERISEELHALIMNVKID